MCHTILCRTWAVGFVVLSVGVGQLTRGEDVTVFSISAEVKDGDDHVIFTPEFGQELRLEGVEGDKAEVAFEQDGEARRGWVHVGHIVRRERFNEEQRAAFSQARMDQRASQEARARGDYRAALDPLLRALEAYRSVLGEKHIWVANIANAAANRHGDLGEYARAEPLYREALDIYQAVIGEQHADYSNCLGNLALLYDKLGDPARAEPLYLQALEVYESTIGKEHSFYAISLNNLAGLYQDMGDYAQAERCYLQARDIRKAVLGPKHSDYAGSLNNLAILYADMGDYARAEPLYREALDIKAAVLGKQHPEYANSFDNLAALLRKMGDRAQSETLYREALEIRRTVLGESHPDFANSLNNLATLYDDMRDFARAEPLYLRSLEIYEAALGKEHPNFANCLDNLGNLCRAMGDYARADMLLRQAAEIRKEVLGEKHPAYADSLNNLGTLFDDQGDHARAAQFYGEALAIRKAILGEHHPDYAYSLNNLARSEARQEAWTAAATWYGDARRAVRRHVTTALSGLPESTQGALVGRTYQEDLGVALSLAVACPEDTAIAKATAEWLLNGKGLAHEALAARTILVHESSDPVVGQTARELLAVRQQLAQWTLRSPSIGQLESYRQRLEELARQEARLAQRVAQQTGRTAATGDWRELNSVRDRLPGGSALIDIVRFPVGDFRAHRFLPDHYAAWITPASTEGEVRFVDLGEAERIDELVEALRAALAAAPTAIRETGEPEANAALAQPLTDLARQVLHPILARIGDARHLILSPDAGLWLVPWAALPLPGDEGPDEARFLVEEYQIRYVRSGRDLWRRQRSDREPSESIVLADPDFDLGPTTSSRQTTVSADGDRPGLGIIHRRSRDHVLSDWIRLPGTATEARAIAPSIEQLTGAAPAVRLRADAQEAVVKAAHGPRVLVLSTHGFFLADQVFRTAAPTDSPDDSQPPMLTATGHPWENPLLRCGLVLAGANRRTDDRDDSREDGILTGLEIVGCDLRGTELVVLSACDTGVGDVRNGEGVAGLRQAFLLAGVQSVLATLWQIPDKETSRLMNDFFQNLAAGQSHAAALRNAQLTQIAARRERNGAAHPFFWAAFTQTGAE